MSTSKAPLNVLFIDDEEGNLVSFRVQLRRYYKIFTAISAADAWPILEQNTIQVVISDQRMPEKTGIEFFEEMLKKYPDPIRILVTGYTDLTAVIDAINRGQVYRYLTKPWITDDLRNSIEAAYEVYRLREENKELTERLLEVNMKLEFLARQSLLS